MKAAWKWFWYGRLCKRCGVERTNRHFIDDICITCYVVELIKWMKA